MTETVPKADYVINYAGKNITNDISRYLSTLKYKDSTKGKSDEIEITLDDSDGKWRNEWYPAKKDKISARISAGGPFLDCGVFILDEIEYDMPPDIITMRGLATDVGKKLRTKKYKSHEGKTLKQIAQSVCDEHGFTLDTGSHVVTKKALVQADIDQIETLKGLLFQARGLETTAEIITALQDAGPKVGALRNDLKGKSLPTEADMVDEGFRWLSRHYSAPGIDYYLNRLAQVESRLSPYLQKSEKIVVANDLSSIQIERSTQNGETDLAYLTRIAAEYGFYFNIKGQSMIFYMVYDLEGRNPSITISKSQLSKCNIKDTSVGTVKSATVTSHNPMTNEVITSTASPEPLFPIENMKSQYRPSSISLLKDPNTKSAQPSSIIEGSGSSAQDDADPNELTAEDDAEVITRVENQQQADAKAKGLLHASNKKAVSGTFTTAMDIQLVSGNNVRLVDLGQLSGIYHIESAEFTLDRSGGASVTCEVYRVGKVDKSDKKL